MSITRKLGKAIIYTMCTITICIHATGIYASNKLQERNTKKESNTKFSKDEIKKFIKRFQDGDKSLKQDEISSIYYQYQVPNAEEVRHELTKIVDSYIKGHSFDDAQRCAEGALATIPYDLGILNRCCDLSQHNKDPKVDIYVWQLASFFYIISRSGDGSSYSKALKVRSERDAVLYETLWQQVPEENIKSQINTPRGNKHYIVITIKNKDNSKEYKYYEIINI